MMKIRKSQDRGHANHGWLDTRFTFSFADYYDPDHMGFADLRVINDDIIAPGKGFGTHPHKDMEIVTYVLDGALEHRDSMGNGSVIKPGDVQRMSAGTGVSHSEFNHSQESPVHLLQIWILPNRSGHQPGYEQKHFPGEEKRGRLRLIASENGDSDSVSLNQDVRVFAGLLDGDEEVNYQLEDGRVAWIHVAQGEIEVNGEFLSAGDGASLDAGSSLHLGKGQKSEILLFDMAA
jgi:redox-sensitive bicupin YhaK (pirin superfamily)